MNICLFEEREIIDALPLPANDERALHIKKILKKKVGESFAAGIIDGKAGLATITKIGEEGKPDEGAIYFSFKERSDGKKLFPLEMIIGFPRPIQLKRLLRDMAALGVRSVHLAGTELGEKSYLESSLAQKSQVRKMLYEGTVQAGGTHIPKNFIYPSLCECLENFSRSQNKGQIKIALDNVNPKFTLTNFLNENPVEGKSVVAAIGSERGWTNGERKLLESRGFVRLGMGERIMRTETAATVAASIILARMKCLE
ncbi:MAG: 16S rRNA (uracil(1498)-N(3))-methyltransferase [Treponemataceae bacterium]|nr:16S rRNA (uracil(1498)-N(3))-methyltransferase [Treponemataceae bacterium]